MISIDALLRRVGCAGLLALALALGAHSSIAHADDDTVEKLAKVFDIAGGIPGIPVTGDDIRESKEMFNCIDKAGDNDVAIANCVDQFLGTGVGKQAAGQAGLPSWFRKLVQVYVDVRTEDWWALVEDVGMTVACAAAQVLAAGTDVCGIAQAIIELAGAAKKAFDDVVAFLEDVGCAIGVSDCGPGKPAEAVAYDLIFAPRIADGLKARKNVSPGAFVDLQITLEKNGLTKPAKLSVPSVFPLEFTKTQIDKASAAWKGAVDKRWTDDMFKNVLPARSTKQVEYNTSAQVAKVAAAAAAAYLSNPKSTDPHKVAVDTCAVTDFGKAFGYAHVDRWINEYPNEAKTFAGLKSNHDWCAGDFFGKNVAAFAKHFHDRLVATNTCAAAGPGLLCQTIAKYETCLGLMTSAGQPKQCGVNAAGVGKELADKLNKYFVVERNSKFAPCRVDLPDGSAPASTKPAAFVCKRPTLQYFCKQKLADFWKHPAPAPLECATPELDPAYAILASQVKQAATALQAKYPSVGVDAVDPLVVHAGKPDVFAALKGTDTGKPQRQAFEVDFQYQAAFSLTIDGVSRATITGDLQAATVVKDIVPPSAAKALEMKPADPDPTSRTQPAWGAPGPAGAGAIDGKRSSQPATALPSRGGVGLGQLPARSQPATAASSASTQPNLGSSPTAATAGASPPVAATDAIPQATVSGPASPAPQAAPTQRTLSAPTPDWNAATRAGTPSPAAAPPMRTRTATPSTTPPSAAAPATIAPAVAPDTARAIAPGAAAAASVANLPRELVPASCTISGGATRLSCTTRAGWEQCETLRLQRKVEQCTLEVRR